MMELHGKKIEFDLEEFVPLLLKNKQEGFRLIGEKFLNAVMEREFEAFIGAGKHERSDDRGFPRSQRPRWECLQKLTCKECMMVNQTDGSMLR